MMKVGWCQSIAYLFSTGKVRQPLPSFRYDEGDNLGQVSSKEIYIEVACVTVCADRV
jgi:hypothetical protein